MLRHGTVSWHYSSNTNQAHCVMRPLSLDVILLPSYRLKEESGVVLQQKQVCVSHTHSQDVVVSVGGPCPVKVCLKGVNY